MSVDPELNRPPAPRPLHAVAPKVGVHSEAGRLRRVLLHRPGRELERLTPQNMADLLFDDLPWPERAREEHDAFAQTLRDQGAEVLLLEQLLVDVLRDPAVRAGLSAIAHTEADTPGVLRAAFTEHLRALDAPQLAQALLAGVTLAELQLPAGSLARQASDPASFVLDPAANALFTRDTSAWVGDHVELCAMHFPARRREMALLAALHAHHPAFAGGTPLPGTGIEGGDVLVPGRGVVVCGMGERTRPAAVEAFAARLIAAEAATTVIAVRIPAVRETMHLDTLFSWVDHDMVVAHPVVAEELATWTITADGARPAEGLKAALSDTLGRSVRFVSPAAPGAPAERAQWADAHNVLAVAPGVVCAYDRTPAANEGLRKAGVTVLEVPGGELGRGSGGPRCLSCPVARDA